MMLTDIQELRRLASPIPLPQALVCDNGRIWLSSRGSGAINVLDAESWKVEREYTGPGPTFGLTVAGDELRAVVSEDDDDRYLRRFLPASGFAPERHPLPELTGSYLGFAGGQLYLTQWYYQKLLLIDDRVRVSKAIDVPHQICGCVAVGAAILLMTTDDEESNDYFITRVDVRKSEPTFEDLARVPFHARSLAWDGERFWTNHREADQTVAFKIPV